MSATFYKLRLILIALNVILFLIGAGMIAVGAWLITDKDDVMELANLDLDGDYRDPDTPGLMEAGVFMTAITGGLLVLESIYTCLAIGQLSKQSLITTCVTLFLIILVQITIITILAIQRVTTDRHLKDSLYKALATDYEGFIVSANDYSTAFDKAQVQFDCCGIENYTDFHKFARNWPDSTSLQIPKACCKLNKDSYLDNTQYVFLQGHDCARKPTLTNTNIAKSCYDSIKGWLDRASLLCLIFGVVATVFEIVMLSTMVVLIKKVNRDKKERQQYLEDSAYKARHRYNYRN